MSDMLGISSGAIGAYQRALTTVSNNIANVNTEGYSRQDVVLQDSAPKKMAGMYIGTGVMLQSIKRQFDEFAESNLRSSTSDLASQKPMVDYAKRVMDVMGDKSIGLSSAFDDFFSAAGALSADPASTVLRTSFLRSADGVASRFGELSKQLDLVSTETRQGIESVADKVNTLTAQLALINQGLTKSPTLEGQPPELLDRRDLTLRQLSELTRTKTTYTSNGIVNVSLGTTMAEGLVVNGIKARPIGIDSKIKEKVELVIEPYGNTETLASASGGLLGGYQSFIAQVLEPTQKSLDTLAKTFVNEANAIQKNGIDGYGQMGQNLFEFDPAATNPAAAVRMTINDSMRIATAGQFRVSEGNTNVTTTRASVKFTGSTPATPLSNAKLVNNPNPTAGVTFKVDGSRVYAPVTTLSAGVKAAFYIDQAEPGQQLQVMTRDGRQLLGQTLTETEKFQLFTPSNGFVPNATYSDQYLNKSGVNGYRGLDLFYGAKAEVLYAQNFDQYGAAGQPIPMPANLESARIATNENSIPAGALILNGVALDALEPTRDAQGNVTAGWSATDVSNLINAKSDQTHIHAEVFSEILVPIKQIDVSKGLSLNGVSIGAPTLLEQQAADYTPLGWLTNAINTAFNGSLTASNNSKGEIVLKDNTGAPITIDANQNSTNPAVNALDLSVGTYNPQVRMTQVVRDMHVSAADLDFNKPLQINGVNFSEAAYDVSDTALSVQFGVQQPLTVTGSTPQAAVDAMVSALNLDTTFSAGYKAANVSGRLTITAIDAGASDADISNVFTVTSGTTVQSPKTKVKDIHGLIDRINSRQAQTGVAASLDDNLDLKLSTTTTADPDGTINISIGPGKDDKGAYVPNALGLEPKDYGVADRLTSEIAYGQTQTDIRMTFGSYTEGDPPVKKFGSPSDLSALGFRTGAYIEGGNPDDLLLFVTGKGSASVSVGFSGQPDNPRDSLRQQSLLLKFTATDRYNIIDANTGTVLADRHYDPTVLEPVVEFNGLQIKLTHAPSVGDSYKIDGNQDGLGNNTNMLDMVDLNKKPVLEGKSVANSYIDQINNVGNLAQQANITQQAMMVVNDQAVAARDKVSGVNLDEEAAALIRYQQAYQACAKALQVSGQLFDTIEQIR
jgi:flagellar hook-associated protein FlgK